MQRRFAGALLAVAILAACADQGAVPPTAPTGPRLAVEPLGARIVINEVMADPSAVADDRGEWLEVHNWGDASANLQGWTIASNNDAPHVISTSIVVPAGGYVVLAREGNRKRNGGLTGVDHTYGTALTLANGADWVALRDGAGVTVDSAAWSSMPTGASRGVKDPSADNAAVGGTNWQTQTSAYGSGDKGTPDGANDGYLAPIVSVTLTPTAATVAPGGTQQFTATANTASGGTATTTYTWTSSDPAVATVSSTGLATAVAAGTATIRATTPGGVAGEATLTVSGGGTGGGTARIVINEVLQNPSAVTDDLGEWFEVHNWGDAAADLQGWTIASNNDGAHVVASSVVVPAGGYVVLARNASSAQNGGVPVAYAYGTGLNLANSSDWVALRDASGASVDSVAWSSVPTGASRGVRDPAADNADQGSTNWQTQTSSFGAGDKGTPGAQNDGYVSPVPAGPPATVVVAPASASTTVGGTAGFSATAYDANGKVTSTTFTWSSASPSVATVTSTGTATGVAVGTATITAMADNGVGGSGTLTVSEASVGTGSELVVHVLDVGQGDANLILNGTSKVLIDGGPDMARMGVLLDSLGLNNSTIDVVILSHQHYDHLSGIRELFNAQRNITVRYFFENKDAYSTVSLAEMRDSVNARVARGETVYRDTDDPCANGSAVCTITMNGGAKLHVMRPNPAGSSPNDRSTPVKLVGPDSASFSMFFAGDAEHEALAWFDTGANYDVFPGMRVSVVKGNHHGSCNGVASRFVELTSPDWVTFSLSATNTYGHVHTQTKDMYGSYGRPWYRTDQNGTVTFRSPGTPGGGYTVSVQRGSANSSGPEDRASTQSGCNPMP